jgi:hypothetical protein
MICPECGGSGRVRKRFLFFFTRRARCRTCLGTGEFPPAVPDRIRVPPRLRDEDDGGAWAARGYGAGAIGVAGQDSPRDDPPRQADSFEAGSGGRSGGGGGGASWGDPADDKAPIIVDPFAADAGTASSAIVAAAADAADSGSWSDASSSGDAGGASSADSGTSY